MFCPECGNTDLPIIEGVCRDCFLKKFSILKIPKKIEATICSHCNSKFEEGKWEDSHIPEEEVIYRALERAIAIDPLVENEEIELEILQMRGTIAECYIEATGTVFGKTIKEEFETDVRLQKTVCPSCSKINSGYYEAVIQLRADTRELTTNEIAKSDTLVKKTLNKLSKKDKLAYLVQIAKLKEGNDYYIGSYKSGKKVVEALKEEFGGIIKESPRLISQDKSTGKGLYRIWISLRLPEFEKGDFIKIKSSNKNNSNLNKIAQIIAIDGKRILAIDLDTFKNISISWKDYETLELMKKYNLKEKTTITSKSPNKIQILDPDDYTPVDLDINENMKDLNIGDEVEVIKIENSLYILPKIV
ncbi:MAG: hypothetical protein LBM26_05630 [Methanobrevibacter sp.]|jgi:nonsense-mediated mRNA decay protein 3|nr:hypothetical protein [Methanobrevibacter sp.]